MKHRTLRFHSGAVSALLPLFETPHLSSRPAGNQQHAVAGSPQAASERSDLRQSTPLVQADRHVPFSAPSRGNPTWDRLGLAHAVEEFGEPQFRVMVRRRFADYTRWHGSAALQPGC